jgi:hypothetical protein
MRRRRNSADAPQLGAACRLQRHVRPRTARARSRCSKEAKGEHKARQEPPQQLFHAAGGGERRGFHHARTSPGGSVGRPRLEKAPSCSSRVRRDREGGKGQAGRRPPLAAPRSSLLPPVRARVRGIAGDGGHEDGVGPRALDGALPPTRIGLRRGGSTADHHPQGSLLRSQLSRTRARIVRPSLRRPDRTGSAARTHPHRQPPRQRPPLGRYHPRRLVEKLPPNPQSCIEP